MPNTSAWGELPGADFGAVENGGNPNATAGSASDATATAIHAVFRRLRTMLQV
jgi:hypothetical protein